MKKLQLTAVLMLLGIISLTAQSLSLRLNSKPSPYLSDWEGHQETVQLVINHSGNEIEAKIKAQLFRNGTLVAASDLAAMPVMTIEPGVMILGPEDLVPFNYVTYYGNVREQAIRTGRLPAGEYQLCLSLVEPFSLGAITQPMCQPFFIPDYQPPACLFPLNQTELSTTSLAATTLRWTPVMPLPSDHDVLYEVQVYEVLPGQYPQQAIRSNRPIVALTVENQTFLPWPTDYELPDSGKYVWTVKAMDLVAEPVGFSVQSAGGSGQFAVGSSQLRFGPCRFNDIVLLFDCETCQLLKGECGESMVPESKYEEEPESGISVSWGETPTEVQQGAWVQAQVETSADPLVLDFSFRSLATGKAKKIAYTSQDFRWNTTGLEPGMYELQARVANGHNASNISSFYLNISPAANTGNIAYSMDISGMSDQEVREELGRVRDRINRLPGQISREENAADNYSRAVDRLEDEQIRDRRRRDELAGSAWRNGRVYQKLYEIDQRFNQVPVAIYPKVDELIKRLDSLKNLGVAPKPDLAALRAAVAAAQANLKACQDARDAAERALNNLKTSKSDKHDELMQTATEVTDIMKNHGWSAGVHPHDDGRVGFGGVGDANNTLQPGHSDYNAYNDGFNRGRQLNREIKRLNRQIAAAQAAFDAMDDCKDEEEALEKAQQALANGNMSQAAQNQLDDLCKQIKELIKPLKTFCEQNPGACSDLLKEKVEKMLGDDCPKPEEWRMLKLHFRQLVQEKERIENQAKARAESENSQRERLDEEIDRRQSEIDRLREQERLARERADEARRQLAQDNAAKGPLEAEAEARRQSAATRNIRPAQPYADPLDLSGRELKARAWSALHELSGRVAWASEGSDCSCKMIALRAAKQVNNTPGEIIGSIGIGVIFAPLQALPLGKGGGLGLALLKDFATSLFGGGDFSEDAFNTLMGFAGGEIFERLIRDDFLAGKVNELALGAVNEAMGAMADDLEKMGWEGETTVRCSTPRTFEKKVKVTVNGLFNKRTGWTVLVIKTDDPNCPSYMVKYRLDERGILISNSIQAKAM